MCYPVYEICIYLLLTLAHVVAAAVSFLSHSEWFFTIYMTLYNRGARCSSVVRAFTHGATGHRIDPSWGGPIELFLIPASAPQLV